MSLPLSIVSTALHLFNAGGFVLLTPSAELADYISASVLFSAASWTCIWVLPSVWEYRVSSISELRGTQLMVVIVGVVIQILVHPNAIGYIFSVLLIIEAAVFMPYLMLYESRSDTLIRSDFFRAIINSISLILAVFIFHGSPVAYALGLVVSLVLVSGTLAATGIYRAPFPRIRIGFALAASALRTAFSSLRFRQLAAARGIEVAATLSLNSVGALGTLLALKAGVVAIQATAFNARRLGFPQLLLLGFLLYAAGMGVIFLGNLLLPSLIPHSLRLIGLYEAFVAFWPFAIMLVLTVLSVRQRGKSAEGGDL